MYWISCNSTSTVKIIIIITIIISQTLWRSLMFIASSQSLCFWLEAIGVATATEGGATCVWSQYKQMQRVWGVHVMVWWKGSVGERRYSGLRHGTFDWRLWRTHCGCGDGWPSRTLGRGEGRGRPPSSCPLRRRRGVILNDVYRFRYGWVGEPVMYSTSHYWGQAWKQNLLK